MGAGDVTVLGPEVLAALAGSRRRAGEPDRPGSATADGRAPARPARRPGAAAARHRRPRSTAAVAAAGTVVGFTGVLGVRHVTVTGVRALSADQVRAAAGCRTRRPLARVDTGAWPTTSARCPGSSGSRSPGPGRHAADHDHRAARRAVVTRAGACSLVDPDGVVVQRAPAGRSCRCSTSPTSGRTTRPPTARWPRSPRCRRRLLAAVDRAGGDPGAGDARPHRRPDRRSGAAARTRPPRPTVLGALLSRPGRHYDVSTPSVVTVR